MALSCAAIVGGIGGAAFMVVQSKMRSVHQAASWDQALFAAESGVEIAMEEIRKGLYDTSGAWKGWTLNDPADQETGENPTMAPAGKSYSLTAPAVTRNNEGGQRSWSQLVVYAPACLFDSSGEQWYRIRSLGAADIPGGRVVTGDKEDNALRKYSLVSDRFTGQRVAGPQSTRFIEAVAKPVGAFRLALFGIESIDLTDKSIVVDSYDSRDPDKSTNGAYDAMKRQEHGDIATNGEVINAGSAQIHGDAMTNHGTVLNNNNVTGEIRDDFFQDVFAVRRPQTLPDLGTPQMINHPETINARADRPSNYQFSAVSLTGDDVLRVKGAEDGSPTFVQIVVTGDLRISGTEAAIQLDPGVYARIFVEGDTDIQGRGILNTGSSTHLQVYGVQPPEGERRTLKIAGNGGFNGAVYAPAHDLRITGGGQSDSVFGSFVGRTISMTGVQSVHYDQALGQAGMITDYRIVSWFEGDR